MKLVHRFLAARLKGDVQTRGEWFAFRDRKLIRLQIGATILDVDSQGLEREGYRVTTHDDGAVQKEPA